MDFSDELEKILKAYSHYYNILTETEVDEPFVAEAIFHSHRDQYVVMKRARIAEEESHEYVFFAVADELDLDTIKNLDQVAWERGLSRVKLSPIHRSTDIALIVLAGHITDEARDFIKKSKHYKSYKFSFQGRSAYQLIAKEVSTGALVHNRLGKDLCKLFRPKKPKWSLKN